jgi:hypothetical protein
VARQEPGLLSEYYRVRNRLGFLAATAPRRVVARALATHLGQIARDARASAHGRELALGQLHALRDFARGRWGRAPAHYLCARRRDWATGGALHAPPEPSWAPYGATGRRPWAARPLPSWLDARDRAQRPDDDGAAPV